MSETERLNEWLGFIKASPEGYTLNALIAVLENDGERMLGKVLTKLGLESPLELIKELARRGH